MKTKLTHSQRIIGAFTIMLSGLLLVLAAQMLPVRLLALSGDDLRETVLDSTSFSDEDFAAFIQSREASVAWHPMAEYLDELAAAYTARASRENTSPADIDRFLQNSLDTQTQALLHEPADTYGWSQRAFLDIQQGQESQAADDLRLSIETAPYEPALMPSRRDMMQELHDQFSPEEMQFSVMNFQ